MLELKGNGALRLRCDGEWCERKFVPIRRLTDAKQLRTRAALYGWKVQATPQQQLTIAGTDPPAAPLDLCPECGAR